jgi:anthranilate synthase component 1
MLSKEVVAAALAAPPGTLVPVVAEAMADTLTPVSAFLRLRGTGPAFLLESGEQDGRLGRYSFIGTAPDAVLRAELAGGTVTDESGEHAYQGGPLEAVRRLAGSSGVWQGEGREAHAGLPRFSGGVVGAFGYDLVRALERLPGRPGERAGFPAALFARYHTVLAFDHSRQRLLCISLVTAGPAAGRRAALARAERRITGVFDRLQRATPALQPLGAPRETAPVSAVPDDARFIRSVERALEEIAAGEAIQVVLSRRLRTAYSGDAFDLYRSLRMLSPSPYMFYLEFPEVALAGCSPEMQLRVEAGVAQLSPIAGTRPRGSDAAGDAANEAELAGDEKERAEHVMLVDLARNDLGRVCRTGSVGVPRLMQVERFSHVMHLVSVVTGRLREDVDALDAFAACFPAGTVSGAPKVRAMQLIDELESGPRGEYAGAVAHIAPGVTQLDSCITIRTFVVKDGEASLRVGAGVVADSVPERELAETNAKARALLAALEHTARHLPGERPPRGAPAPPRVLEAAP